MSYLKELGESRCRCVFLHHSQNGFFEISWFDCFEYIRRSVCTLKTSQILIPFSTGPDQLAKLTTSRFTLLSFYNPESARDTIAIVYSFIACVHDFRKSEQKRKHLWRVHAAMESPMLRFRRQVARAIIWPIWLNSASANWFYLLSDEW